MVATAITILTVPLIALYELTNERRPEGVVAVVVPVRADRVSAAQDAPPADPAGLGQATADAAQVALVGAEQLAATSTVPPTTVAPTTTGAPAPTTTAAPPTPTTEPRQAPTTAAGTATAPVPPATIAAPTTTPPPTTTTTSTTTTMTTTTGAELVPSPIPPFPYEAGWPKVERWDRLAECEAWGTWDIDTGNGYYGGLQFAMESWQSVGGEGYPSGTSRAEQIYRANLLWERQGWGAWPVCTRELGWR